MGKYGKKQAACAQTISTLGGDYALKWDDETQMSVNAHAALLSQFAKAGGFFDRLVETCPMRLTSNNFASIPGGQALPWAWRENLHLLQDVIAEDCVLDLDPTVKPLYGHQEGAEFGYTCQRDGVIIPSKRCHLYGANTAYTSGKRSKHYGKEKKRENTQRGDCFA